MEEQILVDGRIQTERVRKMADRIHVLVAQPFSPQVVGLPEVRILEPHDLDDVEARKVAIGIPCMRNDTVVHQQ